MSAVNDLIDGMVKGRSWEHTGDSDTVRELLWKVYDERYHKRSSYKDRFQVRVNLQKKADAASYAGWITAENPTSGPYQGTSFVWMPAEVGSIAVLVIGTDGFGADTSILGRPGHRRRLKALSRLNSGKLWVKPDFLDIVSAIPSVVSDSWPDVAPCLRSYSRVIYAAVPVRSSDDYSLVTDLIDLFFYEHGIPLTGSAKASWEKKLEDIAGAVFPAVSKNYIMDLLNERRFVILEGPPGTGKTHLAYQLADSLESATKIQFHAARTYEDFVVGLFPNPASDGLSFDVKAGDLLKANKAASSSEHILVIDEINRADISRVFGEAIVLFESGDESRSVKLPHVPPGYDEDFRLSPNLMVLGTRNTADRTIARIDIAIRRRFAFVEMWPDLNVVRNEGIDLAIELFADTIHTFAEYADEDTLRLVPGHSYFMDPRPGLDSGNREERVARRIRYELLPLLRDYLDEKLCGAASEAIAGLADRIESRILGLK